MNKIYLLFVFTFFSCGRTDKNTHKSTEDTIVFSGMGYDKLNLYIYKVDEIENGIVLRTDTLGLFCSGIVMKNQDSQSYIEWQFLTRRDNKYAILDFNNTSTGLKVNDTELYIHPPRFGIYRILQFCPHPEFYNTNLSVPWHWDLPIGSSWSIANLYPIKDVDTFRNIYQYVDTATINTQFGNLFCFHYKASGTSIYGTSYGTYYLNNTFGLVDFRYQTTNNLFFNFKLISKTDNCDSIKINTSLTWFLHHSNKKTPYDFNSF